MGDYLLLSFFPDFHLPEEEYSFKPDSFDFFGGVLFEEYYHNEYGFYTDDDTNALAHAAGLLLKMREDPNLDFKPSLLEDFSNYLQCLESGLGNREDAYQFILLLLSLGLEKDTVRIILEYYERNNQPETPLDALDERSYLDFDILYLKVADKLLFEKYDVETAIQYYGLVSKKWNTDSSDHGWYRNDRSGLNDKDKEIVSKKIEVFEMIYAGLPYINLEIFDFKDKETLAERFNNLILSGFKRNPNFNNEANSFVADISNTLNKVDDYSRVCLLMIASLTKYCSDIVLFSLSNDNSKVQDQYSHRIINLIKRTDNKKYKYIKDWLENNSSDTAYRTILLFVKAIFYVDIIKDALEINSFGEDTAYYTSLDTFSLLFPENCKETRADECGKLSVMNVSYMNDPNEGLILRNKVYENGDIPKNYSERVKLPTPYVFLKCFTSMIDYLPMWQMYGDGGRGVCLVLDRGAGIIHSLYRICYIRKSSDGLMEVTSDDNPNIDVDLVNNMIEELKTLYTSFDTLEEQIVFDHSIDSISYLFKDSTYSYEQEKRIMYIYDSKTKRIRYTQQNPPKLYVLHGIPLYIKEVILGPKFSDVSDLLPYLGHQLELMADKFNYSVPKITISNIDFK